MLETSLNLVIVVSDQDEKQTAEEKINKPT